MRPSNMTELKRVALKRLAICSCGYGTLKDGIAVGKEYLIDSASANVRNYKCGGCGRVFPTTVVQASDSGVRVADYDSLSSVAIRMWGWLPADLFEDEQQVTLRRVTVPIDVAEAGAAEPTPELSMEPGRLVDDAQRKLVAEIMVRVGTPISMPGKEWHGDEPEPLSLRPKTIDEIVHELAFVYLGYHSV